MVKYIFPIFVSLLCSCNEKVVEKPENIIPEDKMASILYDISILNAGKINNVGVLNEFDIKPMEYIYKKYDIDSIQFVGSDLYYASIPTTYETIYTKVKEKLEADEKFFEEERQRKQDSIVEAEKKSKLDLKTTADEIKDTVP